ncbi:MAG: class B sortase [Oscillospiraceae bacterium]|nr:class B sortase [Oscillospiraceae bacterium]
MKKAVLAALAVLLCLSAGAAAFFAAGRIQRAWIYGKLKEKAPFAGSAAFEELRAVNPDIFAWISIPGTDVDYPVVKHPDDDAYYLTHTVEGAAGSPASIFACGYTAEDFSQFNTVLYGHDPVFGGMFSELNRFYDPAYREEHKTVRIGTPEGDFTYTVVACVDYDDRLIDTCFDQRDPADRRAFVASVRACLPDGAESAGLEAIDVLSDHLLTLETCRGAADRRTVVLAVRND